ncbi:MAG: peptidylprolyl isomerase [Dysgonamonadaceae bacterium]|jgi:peptidyl-prolyl cis-trans isomerase SurA|nr:peptidylprolyl isomerase [Dysgonamonadaceae bacterium]
MRLSIKIFFLFLVFSSVNQNVISQSNVIDEIVWVVGDEAILRSEVEEFRKEMLMRNQRMEGDPFCFIPEQIALNKLFLDQARIDSIEVSDAMVNRAAETQLNEWIASIGSQERLVEYFGKSITSIREDLRNNIREGELINGVQRKHFGDIRLTPSEIRRFYSNMPQDSLPFIPTTVEVQIITIEPEIPMSETDAVRARLRQFTEQILSGEQTFQNLAIVNSDCPSGMRGGELGFAGRATYHAEFSNAAFALTDPTRVSNIVETIDGFHIIQLIERRGDQGNFRHILLRPRVPQESLDTALVRLDSIRTGIIDNRFTFDEAATFLSDDRDTRMNRGVMVNPLHPMQSANGGTPRFALDELNQDIARIAGNMTVGEVSEPFTMLNNNGRRITAIVRITNRTDGHRATLTRDYQVIRQLAEEARRQELMDEWVRAKIRTTYVRINPNWQNCEFKYDGWLR